MNTFCIVALTALLVLNIFLWVSLLGLKVSLDKLLAKIADIMLEEEVRK